MDKKTYTNESSVILRFEIEDDNGKRVEHILEPGKTKKLKTNSYLAGLEAQGLLSSKEGVDSEAEDAESEADAKEAKTESEPTKSK